MHTSVCQGGQTEPAWGKELVPLPTCIRGCTNASLRYAKGWGSWKAGSPSPCPSLPVCGTGGDWLHGPGCTAHQLLVGLLAYRQSFLKMKKDLYISRPRNNNNNKKVLIEFKI